ncbi:MAG: hypothetical protein P8N72_04570 [Flavimaricola sp.]|nr:hypothetical protein [Flavimaricola sp.]
MTPPQTHQGDPPETDVSDEADLWFLPGPIEEYAGQSKSGQSVPGKSVPGPSVTGSSAPNPPAWADEVETLTPWIRAEAQNAAKLGQAAALLGALDDRLGRVPDGWRQRLALLEAVDIGWLAGDRVGLDQLSLWLSLRLTRMQDDAQALARTGWAVRRLTGQLRPDTDLIRFLGRSEASAEGDDRLSDRVAGWTAMMAAASDLHPISRAAVGFNLWSLAGLGQQGDRLEAAVTAARFAATDSRGGAVFAPLALGGGRGLRAYGPPSARMTQWYDGLSNAVRAAMRHLDTLEAWQASATSAIAPLSGRTPARLLQVVAEWPVVSARMAEEATGASRAAIQRNLTWMEDKGILREVTGQGRFRYWAARLSP